MLSIFGIHETTHISKNHINNQVIRGLQVETSYSKWSGNKKKIIDQAINTIYSNVITREQERPINQRLLKYSGFFLWGVWEGGGDSGSGGGGGLMNALLNLIIFFSEFLVYFHEDFRVSKVLFCIRERNRCIV